MDVDDEEVAREKIWDFVFQHGELSTHDLAQQLGLSLTAVQQAVQHEWFTVEGEDVRIASQP